MWSIKEGLKKILIEKRVYIENIERLSNIGVLDDNYLKWLEDSYEDFSREIRLMGKNFTILPEFRISEHMDYYVNEKGADFRESARWKGC